jgi:hypothetical protein
MSQILERLVLLGGAEVMYQLVADRGIGIGADILAVDEHVPDHGGRMLKIAE